MDELNQCVVNKLLVRKPTYKGFPGYCKFIGNKNVIVDI